MKLSLKTKVTILLAIIVTAVMSLTTYYNIQTQVQNSVENKRQEARLVGRIFGLNFAQFLLTGQRLDQSSIRSARLWLQSSPGAVFLIAYDVEGNQIFQIPSEIEARKNILPFPEKQIKKLLRSDREVFGRWVEGEQFYDALVPVRYHNNEFGVIRLGFDTTRVAERQHQILVKNTIFTGLFWVVAVILGFFATSRFLAPLEELDKTAVQLGEGDLEVRSEINSGDEIEELADVFNTMADRIQHRIKQRERSLAQLEAIQHVGGRLNETGEPEPFFSVLDEALQTLYDVEVFIPLIWDGDVFTAPYSRPELDRPLFVPSHSPPIQPVDDAPPGEYVPLTPEDDWPEPLKQINTGYSLKVGDDLHGALYLKTSRDFDSQEEDWMSIWGTQVCQAVRGMVLEGKVEEYQNQLVKAQEDLFKKKIRAGYTDFLLAEIPDFMEQRKKQGIFYGEDFYESLREAINTGDARTEIMQLQLHRFLVAGAELDEWARSEIEGHFRNFSEAEFKLQWHRDESVDARELQNFIVTPS